MDACWAATSSKVMVIMPWGSRAQTSASASLRSAGSANSARYAEGTSAESSTRARAPLVSGLRLPLNCIQFKVSAS
jgi:hypothetical protein